jgi:D-alanine-D-alanine ligase
VPARRVRVAVVYGGRSGEHEVSIQSARSVIEAIDPERYEVIPIGITHDGQWVHAQPDALLQGATGEAQRVLATAEPSTRGLVPIAGTSTDVAHAVSGIEVVFPLVHGTYGEDGCLQGLFSLAGIPFVGSGVLGSAVGMDKITMKHVFEAEGLPSVRYVPVRRSVWERTPDEVIRQIREEIGYPCFVKPSNLGSSVGISKVHDEGELPEALSLASEFSSQLIVEQGIDARELECGVLGNEEPIASVVGEVQPAREYYDYDAKYFDSETQFKIPADLEPAISERIRHLAVQAFLCVRASGMARVDFFLDRNDGQIYLNEINTIPGFTSMSAYPMLWNAAGVPYPELIHRLIQLALEQHADEARNRTRFER